HQRAQHAEGGGKARHDAKQLRLGLLLRFHTGDAPLQEIENVFFRNVVDDQLHAVTQEGIRDAFQCLFDSTYVSLHPRAGDAHQVFQVFVDVELLVADDAADQPENAHDLA